MTVRFELYGKGDLHEDLCKLLFEHDEKACDRIERYLVNFELLKGVK